MSRRRLGHRDDSPASTQDAEGSLEDVAADDVEDDVHRVDALELVGLEIHEGVRSELDHGVAILGAAGADDPGAGLASELHGDGPTPPAARG